MTKFQSYNLSTQNASKFSAFVFSNARIFLRNYCVNRRYDTEINIPLMHQISLLYLRLFTCWDNRRRDNKLRPEYAYMWPHRNNTKAYNKRFTVMTVQFNPNFHQIFHFVDNMCSIKDSPIISTVWDWIQPMQCSLLSLGLVFSRSDLTVSLSGIKVHYLSMNSIHASSL